MIMTFGKRQLVIASLVVALGAAVYLNWQFSDSENIIGIHLYALLSHFSHVRFCETP